MLNGVNTFLRIVQEAAKTKPTAVVMTGSKQGITNPPGNPAYNASKAAVKSLAEQLSYELKDTKTSVHLLVPGWTFTTMVSLPLNVTSCANRQDWEWSSKGKASGGLGAGTGG